MVKIVTVKNEIIIGLSPDSEIRSGPFASAKPQYKVTDYAPDMVFQDAFDERAEEGLVPCLPVSEHAGSNPKRWSN